MPESGAYKHQGTLAVRESTDSPGPAFNLAVDPLHRVVGPDPEPVLIRKVHIGQGLIDAFLETPFSGDERHQRRIDLMKDYERSVRA